MGTRWMWIAWTIAIASLSVSLGGTAGARPPAEPGAGASQGKLAVHLRSRVELFKGTGAWEEVALERELPLRETAIIICDMWDKHWCANATKRCDEMARTRMAPAIEAAHALGIPVIHAPSECMTFYKDTPQRRRMQSLPSVPMPMAATIVEPPLPIDDSDGGCDDDPQPKNYQAWTRQHPAIPIAPGDGISDNGTEVYRFLKQRGIKNLLVMGVHTNMCILGRTFAIRQMTRWGIHCILVRDLTDAMYNPKKSPFVSHEAGTELVIQHIEKYWCPTMLSQDLLQASKSVPAASVK